MTRSRVAAVAVLGALSATVVAEPAVRSQAVLETCVVIHDVGAGTTIRSDDRACAVRLAPASTFKVPHALVALEVGAAPPSHVERWDGTPYPGRPQWTHDHTVISALRPSVLWVFQRIAPRVGAARMHTWLSRLAYGNADTSGHVTEYWLNGRLRISPDEQVAFLRRVFAGDLPVGAAHRTAVLDGLAQPPGAVENATGVHRLDVDWRADWRLVSKTGATRMADGTGVSWLVGQWRVGTNAYVFAGAAWRAGDVDGLDGTRAVVRVMRDRVLPR